MTVQEQVLFVKSFKVVHISFLSFLLLCMFYQATKNKLHAEKACSLPLYKRQSLILFFFTNTCEVTMQGCREDYQMNILCNMICCLFFQL